MRIGDVFAWETSKVKRHDSRNKFHVFICRDGRESIFLFISFEAGYGDYLVRNPPYDFLWKGKGYVCTRSIVTYTDDELDLFEDEPVGRLSDDDISELNFAVANSF